MNSGTKSTTRLRKVACPECGYTVRMARSWWAIGLPDCPCGEQMQPTEPCDLAFCGLITEVDVPGPQWTAICRENGWDDAIVRRGNAAKAYARKLSESGGIAGRKVGAAHCVYAGCGLWVAVGADHCTAGHAQHEHVVLEAMPF